MIHVPPVLLQIWAKCEMILPLIFEETQCAPTLLTESQLCPDLSHVNCQDYWKTSMA